MCALHTMLFGDDGESGILGTVRNGGKLDAVEWEKVKEYLLALVERTAKDPSFPAKDMATICDMLLELQANCQEVPELSRCIVDANLILQKWYE